MKISVECIESKYKTSHILVRLLFDFPIDIAISGGAADRRARRSPHLRVQRWPLQFVCTFCKWRLCWDEHSATWFSVFTNVQSARKHEHLAARAGSAGGGRRPERRLATDARPTRAPREREQLAAARAAHVLPRVPPAVWLYSQCAHSSISLYSDQCTGPLSTSCSSLVHKCTNTCPITYKYTNYI